jgi:hypothetical protein
MIDESPANQTISVAISEDIKAAIAELTEQRAAQREPGSRCSRSETARVLLIEALQRRAASR